MTYRFLPFILIVLSVIAPKLHAAEATDTIYNPPIVYSGLPSKYEIAGIRVQGADNYEDYIVIRACSLRLRFLPRKSPATKSGWCTICALSPVSRKCATAV